MNIITLARHILLFTLVLILISSCAANPNCEVAGISDNDPDFWHGLYHGPIGKLL
jgi:hypothetical protein